MEITAGDGDDAGGRELQRRPDQRELQHGLVLRIIQQKVCDLKGADIHDAGNAEALTLVSGAPHILHGREQSRF